MERLRLSYEDGTIELRGEGVRRLRESLPWIEPDPRSGGFRAPAFRYPELRAAIDEAGLDDDDRVLQLPEVGTLSTTYALRDYQREALDAWRAAGDRGVIELPTGSGKTVIAVAAIAALETPTLVVVPTLDLLDQWVDELEAGFGASRSATRSGTRPAAESSEGVPIGQFGGGVQRREPLTVSTYDSAYRRAGDVGDRFGLVVFDEVHHLGAEGYREIARLLAAPARLGLTATFERPDGGHEAVAELVGSRVYSLDPEELAGEHLAPYDVKQVTVELTDEERAEYEECMETFTDYLARSGIELRDGSDYQKLVMRSGRDPQAREALLARQRARELTYGSEAKLDALEGILDRHRGERTIVFTAHNDLAYRVSERFLVPVVTHQTGTDERSELLDRFREGTYTRIVTSNVLDEGVDVPDCSVGIILSGSGSKREFTQRLGRILRPTEEDRRAVLYEVVTEETAEERVAERRR